MSANGTVQAPESTKPKQKVRRWLSRATALVYGLVMFEVVIMVSPFAFYFYAAYGPTLKWLNHSAATAWLTGFVLPHAVFTTSPFLEFLRWDLGRYFFGLGLLGFFVLAAQIYGSKLFRRKVVSSGVYRYIRHPQYLCLGVSAFGLFTMWPRMIIFLLSGLTRSGKRTGGRLMYGMRIATVALLVAGDGAVLRRRRCRRSRVGPPVPARARRARAGQGQSRHGRPRHHRPYRQKQGIHERP